MSIIKGNGTGDASLTGFYSGSTPNQSLRFQGPFGSYLHKAAANISASDRRTFTFSCWFKRSSIKRTQYNTITGQNQPESTPFFQAWQHANNYTAFYLDGTDDVVTYYHYDTGTDYGKKYFGDGFWNSKLEGWVFKKDSFDNLLSMGAGLSV